MGPVMNLALALIVMTGVLYQGAQVAAFQEEPVVIGSFEDNSVAVAAGLQVGDRIVRVDDVSVPNWEDFSMAILPKANRKVRLVIERNGQTIEKEVVPASVSKFELGELGIRPIMRPQS